MIDVTIDGFDILKTLKKYKVLITITLLVCTLMAIAYVIWGKKIYRSQSTFRTLELENIIIPSRIQDLKNFDYITYDSKNPERVNMYSFNLLKTDGFAKKTIEKFNLKEYFEIQETDPYKAFDITLKNYRGELVSFIYDQDSELVTINVESKDAKLSLDIVNYQIELLRNYYRSEFYRHKDDLVNFLNDRVVEVEAKKEIIDKEIKEYDEENSSYELDTKIQVILDNYFQLYQDKLMNEIDLNIARLKYGALSPQAQELAIKDSLLVQQLDKFTENTDNDPGFLTFQDIPEHILTQSTLLNEQELYSDLLSYLRLIYESSKIDRERYQQVVEIIDEAYLAGLPVKPKPTMTIIITVLVSFLLTTTLVYNYDLLRRIHQK